MVLHTRTSAAADGRFKRLKTKARGHPNCMLTTCWSLYSLNMMLAIEAGLASHWHVPPSSSPPPPILHWHMIHFVLFPVRVFVFVSSHDPPFFVLLFVCPRCASSTKALTRGSADRVRFLRDKAVLILLTDAVFGATVEHQLRLIAVPSIHAATPEVC